MAEANTSSTQQAADAQHVDNMTSMQQSTPDAPSGARSDAPVQTNNVGAQDGPSQLNSNPTGNSTNNNNLGGGSQNSGQNGALSGNLLGGTGPGGGDVGATGGALNGLAGNLGGAGNGGGEAGQGGAENAGANNAGGGGTGSAGGGGAGNAGVVAGAGAGARGAGGIAGAGAGNTGTGEASANGSTAGGGEGGGGNAPPATANTPTSPANTTIPLDALTAEELAIEAVAANDESNSSGQPINTVVEAGGLNNAIAGTPSVSNTLISADGSAFTAVTTAAASTFGYGTYSMGTDGTWNYTLNNGNTTVQALNVGGTLTDTFTVSTIDGAQEIVTVRITGANDSAVVSGVTSAVLEKTMFTVDGALTSVDVDNIDNLFIAQSSTLGSNGHGSFTLNANGTWSYQNNLTSFTLKSKTDSFVAVAADGTQKTIMVTQFAGEQPQTILTTGQISLAPTEYFSADSFLSDYEFLPSMNISADHGVLNIDRDGNWLYTSWELPATSLGFTEEFQLPFTYSLIDLVDLGDPNPNEEILSVMIDFTVVINKTDSGFTYSSSAKYSDPDTLPSNMMELFSVPPFSEISLNDEFDAGDHIGLVAQGVIVGAQGIESSVAGNIGVLTVDASGNYTYTINQVPVDSTGRYTSAAPISYDTKVLYDFTTLFYQSSNLVDTFNVLTAGGSTEIEVKIGNSIISTVINYNVSNVNAEDDFSVMNIEGDLGLAEASNVQIISGKGTSNFYATNIGILTLDTDGSYTYVITPEAVSAWETSYAPIASHFDTFLVSYSTGDSLNIQALKFNILQESNTQLIGSSGSITEATVVNDVFLFDYGVPNSSADSYRHVINDFNVEEDRINISKLLTSSSDQLSGTIYIDPAGLNSRSEIQVRHSGSDFTVIEIDGVAASIPELMWNDETRSAPVTSLNALTNWTETLEISGVSFDGSKKFTADGGWSMEIVSGTYDPETSVFTGGSGEVVISQTVGGLTTILQDISHVDKINWSA